LIMTKLLQTDWSSSLFAQQSNCRRSFLGREDKPD
jgi:hypothetical protein